MRCRAIRHPLSRDLSRCTQGRAFTQAKYELRIFHTTETTGSARRRQNASMNHLRSQMSHPAAGTLRRRGPWPERGTTGHLPLHTARALMYGRATSQTLLRAVTALTETPSRQTLKIQLVQRPRRRTEQLHRVNTARSRSGDSRRPRGCRSVDCRWRCHQSVHLVIPSIVQLSSPMFESTAASSQVRIQPQGTTTSIVWHARLMRS